MNDLPSVDQVVNLLLSASNEFGGWALHYDSARFNVTALIVAIVGAGTGFAINSQRKEIRQGGLIAVALVGLALTGLNGEYYRLYIENARVQDKLRQFATSYVTGERKPENFSRCKFDEKVLQGRLEAFPKDLSLDSNATDDCGQRDAYKELYSTRGSLFSSAVFSEVIGSLWILLCLVYAIGIPGICWIMRVQR